MSSVPGRAPRFLAALGGLLLLATAALHGSGYGGISAAIAEAPVDAFVRDVVPSLWLFFSWHLAALAVAAMVAAFLGATHLRPLLWFAAVVAFVDMLWVFTLAGVFIGTALLALAALCLVAAAARWSAGPPLIEP